MSSIWSEPDYVLKVFLTMLVLKDDDHICRLTAYQLSEMSKKPQKEVMEALRILSAPDKRREDQQEYDGRRIQSVEEGWLILNSEKYRSMVQLEMKRARDRKAQRVWREKQKANEKDVFPSKPLAGEVTAVKVYQETGEMP